MQDVREIEENLRLIRRLMERGRRYEAITGRGALMAGTAALGVALLVSWMQARDPFGWGAGARDAVFLVAWPLLALVSAAWLARAAWRIPAGPDDDLTRRLSASARAVCVAVFPPYLLSAALTLGAIRGDLVEVLPGAWIALHGIAILATAYHAPRRLVVLGWIFLGLGSLHLATLAQAGSLVGPNLALGVAFGGLHLAYGLFSVLRPLPAED